MVDYFSLDGQLLTYICNTACEGQREIKCYKCDVAQFTDTWNGISILQSNITLWTTVLKVLSNVFDCGFEFDWFGELFKSVNSIAKQRH